MWKRMYDTQCVEAPNYIPELKGLTKKKYREPEDKRSVGGDSRLKGSQVQR